MEPPSFFCRKEREKKNVGEFFLKVVQAKEMGGGSPDTDKGVGSPYPLKGVVALLGAMNFLIKGTLSRSANFLYVEALVLPISETFLLSRLDI